MKTIALLLVILFAATMLVGTIQIAANHCALVSHTSKSDADEACVFGCSVSKAAAESFSLYGIQLLLFLLPVLLWLPSLRRDTLDDNTTVRFLPLVLDTASPPPQPFFFSF